MSPTGPQPASQMASGDGEGHCHGFQAVADADFAEHAFAHTQCVTLRARYFGGMHAGPREESFARLCQEAWPSPAAYSSVCCRKRFKVRCVPQVLWDFRAPH